MGVLLQRWRKWVTVTSLVGRAVGNDVRKCLRRETVGDLKHIHFAPNPRGSSGWLRLKPLESIEPKWSSVPTQHLSSTKIPGTHCVLKLRRAPGGHDHSLSMLSVNNRAVRTIHTVDQ